MAKADLSDITGFRGEKIVELWLTTVTPAGELLFRPAFLGDKWPTVDFYVELVGVPDRRPFFFVQVKATAKPIGRRSRGMSTRVKRRDVARLLQLPGPTYVFAVHEPSRRAFVKSVHAGVPERAITHISVANELADATLRALYDEVLAYWQTVPGKPNRLVFT